MIDAWRKAWNRPEWPFYFVQLAAYGGRLHDSWADLRAAQAFTRDTVPHTGMALAIDCGEKENIHPRNKQPVGERLARLALADVYTKAIAARGPTFQSLEKLSGKLRIIFKYSENGLKTSNGKPEVSGFEVAGADGKFHLAQARIVSGNMVELTCTEVAVPISVRYAWTNWPEPPVTLQNSAGLPAEPFLHSRNKK
jgi:sialate O-acetylesterase